MVGPVIVPGSPHAVHLATLGDVLGLALHPSTHHLGTPPESAVTYGYSEQTGFTVVERGPGLRQGDVYLTSVADWVAQALLPGQGLPVAVTQALEAAAFVFSAPILGPLTFPAIAWTVPKQRRPTMPSPAHLGITWTGTFDGPAGIEELWSFGMSCAMPAADQTGPALTTIADQLHLAFTQTIGLRLPGFVVLRESRVARIGADGRWERFPDGAWKVGRWLGTLPCNGSATNRFPLQSALCISLSTTRPGATGRGRFFVPWQGSALSDRFLLTNDDHAGWTTSAHDFIVAVQAAAGPVVVASSKGYTSVVNKVRVGQVVDTMRSRRNQQLESYREAAV